jgi:zinc/manganese transport system substrate-binding protein
MIRRTSRAIAVVVATLLVAGCGGDDAGPDGSPTVVATTTILGDVVANVVGTSAAVEVVMPPGADPHDFRPSPRQTEMIRDADLVVANGLGLEEGLIDVLESAEAEGRRVLELGELLDPLPLPGDGDADHEETDEHGHGGEDPHFWHDPLRMVDAVELIADSLEEAHPSVDWHAEAAGYTSTLVELDSEIREMLSPIPTERRKLVTSHEAFGYFADRYDFEIVGAIVTGGSTLAEPSAAHLAELAAIVEAEGVPAVFVESTGSSALAEAVAEELEGGLAVLPLHSEALEEGSGAATYLDMLRSNARTIAEALT